MTPRTVPIVCARAPRHIVYVTAVRHLEGEIGRTRLRDVWLCSFCGARVRVVA